MSIENNVTKLLFDDVLKNFISSKIRKIKKSTFLIQPKSNKL